MPTHDTSKTGSGSRGPAAGEAYGAASITHVLKGVHFPVSKQDLLDRYGREQIRWTQESRPVSLRDCLRDFQRDRFNSITEITQAVSDAAERGTRGNR
jgi:hypothetical protein